MDKERDGKKIFDKKEKQDNKSKHKEVITKNWSESTYLTSQMGKSAVILQGFEFYEDAIPQLKINMAHVKGRKMQSAEDILKAEAFQEITKEKIKESKFKNLFK